MTSKIVNWLSFQRSGVGPNFYTFHCFLCWVALSSNLATLSMEWMTQWAPSHCISLLSVHQKHGAVQQAKWMMQWAPRYCHNQLVAFQVLPGHCIIHTCVAHFKKSSFAPWSLYKCCKYFIQSFLGQTSRMQRNCVNNVNSVMLVERSFFSSQKCVINPQAVWVAIGDQCLSL
jgi:hypothetical protein